MQIFSKDMVRDEGGIVGYNTGTLIDLHLGQYMIGVDGRWYFNGGIGNYIICVEAEPNQHKSSLSDSLQMCIVSNYKTTYFFNLENEGNKDGDRIRGMLHSPLTPGPDASTDERMVLKSHKDCTIEDVDAQVTAICKEIEPNLKKMMQETPFALNDEPIKVPLLTCINIDSFTSPNTDANEKKADNDKDITDSENNMDAMNIGRAKTRYVPKLSRQINKYGLGVTVTVQLGEKKAPLGSNPSIPVAGDTPHAKGGKTAKRVGTELVKRTMATIQIMSAKSLCKRREMKTELMESLQAEYPLGATPPNDIMALTISTSRNKLAPSGIMLDMIISQAAGLLPDVTNFHFLRTLKGYGGFSKATGGRWVLEMYPEVTITRSNLRELSGSDYKLARALDLTARYFYLRSARGMNYLGLDWSLTISELVKRVKALGVDMNDVLETTEIWQPNFPKDKKGYALGAHGRRHMTIVELVELATKGEGELEWAIH